MEDGSLQCDTSRSGQTDRQTDRAECGTSNSGEGADDLMCEILKLFFQYCTVADPGGEGVMPPRPCENKS